MVGSQSPSVDICVPALEANSNHLHLLLLATASFRIHSKIDFSQVVGSQGADISTHVEQSPALFEPGFSRSNALCGVVVIVQWIV